MIIYQRAVNIYLWLRKYFSQESVYSYWNNRIIVTSAEDKKRRIKDIGIISDYSTKYNWDITDCVASKSLDKMRERDTDKHPFPGFVEEIMKEDIRKKKIELEELRM